MRPTRMRPTYLGESNVDADRPSLDPFRIHLERTVRNRRDDHARLFHDILKGPLSWRTPHLGYPTCQTSLVDLDPYNINTIDTGALAR
jgi:hypothetical protein